MGWLTALLQGANGVIQWGLKLFTLRNSPEQQQAKEARIEEQIDVDDTKAVRDEIEKGRPKP